MVLKIILSIKAYHICECGQIDEPSAFLYAAEISLGIGYIYRDLKPENVLIDSDGHKRIADFGLAKQNDASTQTTFCGTSDYMTPEILQQKHYTKDVDWLALGILLFEMLTGMCPFYDDDINQMKRMIIGSDIDFPSSV